MFQNEILEKPVMFSEERMGELGLGVITLNRPKAYNALNTECYALIEPKLKEWIKKDHIAAVWIQASGDKAFCAGGDVKTLVLETQKSGLSFAKEFFTREYFVDYFVHVYPKPVLAWADGITMGGGIGLMNGASHRVVTEKSVLAMPELGIGLFPDVGATHFLGAIKNHFGVFMGLTGARISSADALEVGLADYFAASKQKAKVFADVLRLPWAKDASHNRDLLTEYLSKSLRERPQSENFKDYLRVSKIFALKDFSALSKKFRTGDTYKSQFLKEAQERFISGSPTSQQVFFYAIQRHASKPLREVFMAEWEMALQFSRGTEFPEGVRAVLIDKDNKPRWGNPSWAEQAVNEKTLEEFFHFEDENMLERKLLEAGI